MMKILPFYEEVEKQLGLYGQKDDVATLPDSIYAHKASLNHANLPSKKMLRSGGLKGV